ncbi:MAG: DsbC family protein [Congregibacter sp.]
MAASRGLTFGLLGLVALLLCLVPALSQAQSVAAQTVEKEIEEQLRERLGSEAVGLPIDSIEKSEIDGMYRVLLKQGPAVYTTASGDFFILGDLFSVGVDGFVNLAERRRSEDRKVALADVPMQQKIVFAAEGETRAHITVFTDVSCFYCQKLHKEVPELNRRGIEVRYLAYPRQGIGSPGFRQLASAWCADDRQTTLTRLKNQEPMQDNVCPGNPVAEQFALGQQLGVQGTPAIVTPDGKMLPGYRSADDLITTLGLD